jgi:hypothetical protein
VLGLTANDHIGVSLAVGRFVRAFHFLALNGYTFYAVNDGWVTQIA